MQHKDKARVASLAKQLWEEDGRQEGRSDHYWFAAEQQVAAADIESGTEGQRAIAPAIPLPLPLK